MRGRAVIAATLISLTSPGWAHHRSRDGETITYRMIPTGFCLRCAGYTVTLGPDGQGIFTGERQTAVIGDRRFQADPDAVRAFTRLLARYRPRGEVLLQAGSPACGPPATDQNSLDISWQSAIGAPSHLALYEGCGLAKRRRMIADLNAAPGVLPIADLIGKH